MSLREMLLVLTKILLIFVLCSVRDSVTSFIYCLIYFSGGAGIAVLAAIIRQLFLSCLYGNKSLSLSLSLLVLLSRSNLQAYTGWHIGQWRNKRVQKCLRANTVETFWRSNIIIQLNILNIKEKNVVSNKLPSLD